MFIARKTEEGASLPISPSTYSPLPCIFLEFEFNEHSLTHDTINIYLFSAVTHSQCLFNFFSSGESWISVQCTLFLLSLGHRAAAFWQQPSQLSFPLLSSLFSPDIISHTKETKKKKKFTDRSLLWENGGRLFPLLQEKGRGERDVYRKVFSSYVYGIICCSARTPVCQRTENIIFAFDYC